MSMISVATAAARLGKSEATVRRRIRSGELPAVAERGTWRIPSDAIPNPDPADEINFDLDLAARLNGLPLLLNVEQVAELLGTTLWATRRAIRNGDIPTVQVGSRKMVPTARLAEWLGIAS